METATPKIGYKEIFAQKEYMKSVIASVINRFGDSVDAIASTWIVYELTSNAMWSALIYGMNTLPTVLVTPFAGAFVEKKKQENSDGHNRPDPCIMCSLYRHLISIWLLAGMASDSHHIDHFYCRSLPDTSKHCYYSYDSGREIL